MALFLHIILRTGASPRVLPYVVARSHAMMDFIAGYMDLADLPVNVRNPSLLLLDRQRSKE